MLSSKSYGTNLGEFSAGNFLGRMAPGPVAYSANGMSLNQDQFARSGYSNFSPFMTVPRPTRFPFQQDDGLRMQSRDIPNRLYPGSGIYGDFMNAMMQRRMGSGGMAMNNNTNMLGMFGGGT